MEDYQGTSYEKDEKDEKDEKIENMDENDEKGHDKGTGKSTMFFLKFERVVIFLLFTTDPVCHTSHRRTAIAYHKPPQLIISTPKCMHASCYALLSCVITCFGKQKLPCIPSHIVFPALTLT